MILFKSDYITDLKNLNEVDILDSQLRKSCIEKVNVRFKEILYRNSKAGLEKLFIESLKDFKRYDTTICFTHLDFLISYCEECNIDKFESIEFNNQVLAFYEYLKVVDRISFFHISRIITFMSDYNLGEILFKNIVLDVIKTADYLDGTSIEYFKLYRDELLIESKTFKVWLESNINFCKFLK